MAKTDHIELQGPRWMVRIPILYEDRSVIAIDKPTGWMLVPFSWQKTQHNLQAALTSSIAARDFWARSRNLKFLRHIHRLDADTTGVLLLGTSMGAVDSYGDLFESRTMDKTYLAVVRGKPPADEWVCRLKLAQDPQRIGRMKVDERLGKEAETSFRILASNAKFSLLEAKPLTGRTHQIRVHLQASGHPVVGDENYGPEAQTPNQSKHHREFPLGLRAVELAYRNPFTGRPVKISAPRAAFCQTFRFACAPEISSGKIPPRAANRDKA